MKADDFSAKYDLLSKTELDKVTYLAYFYLCRDNLDNFTVFDIKKWFLALRFSEPNFSRLQQKIKNSNSFIKGERENSFRLHARQIKKFQDEIDEFKINSFELESTGSIIPDSLLLNKKPYIQKFGQQINVSFSQNIYDGCAVLMRRMVEICLIHAYENLNIELQIQSNPNKYKDLKAIINNALTNPTLSLTQGSKTCLDKFRVLGNLSAHKLFYNCAKEEIAQVRLDFRLLIEELFNKAGKKVEK